MKTIAVLLFALSAFAVAKDIVQVEVKATHSVTHEDRGTRATWDKVMLGAHGTTKQIESFNLETVINGEHVLFGLR